MEKTKRYESLFVNLDNKCRVKDAQKIFQQKHALITTHGNNYETYLAKFTFKKNMREEKLKHDTLTKVKLFPFPKFQPVVGLDFL